MCTLGDHISSVHRVPHLPQRRANKIKYQIVIVRIQGAEEASDWMKDWVSLSISIKHKVTGACFKETL